MENKEMDIYDIRNQIRKNNERIDELKKNGKFGKMIYDTIVDWQDKYYKNKNNPPNNTNFFPWQVCQSFFVIYLTKSKSFAIIINSKEKIYGKKKRI